MLLSLPFVQSGAVAGRIFESSAASARALAGAFARAARARSARRFDPARLSDYALRDFGLDRPSVRWLETHRGAMPRGPMT